jgi:hypothetical protein
MNDMTRYTEVCQQIAATKNNIKKSQRRFAEVVLRGFAEYLGCKPEMLHADFGEVFYEDAEIRCDFDLAVKFKNLEIEEDRIVQNLSYGYGKNGDEEHFSVCVGGGNFDFQACKDAIFDRLFEEVSI